MTPNSVAVSVIPREFAHIVDALGLPYAQRVSGQHHEYFIVECEQAGKDKSVCLDGHAIIVNRYFPSRDAANAWIAESRLLNDTPVGSVS